ncbi:type IV pilus biogenesis/stability protein PilW [Paucibacter sp. R3-3]|uniref:Type IV pilus biogenesis/stability protein PilW n=1 Tax=Roseateles agri TaxID=3098619 RepID=A0ABU5DP68_9BURK|nr:type IV pilus biogenesis/stability protein PilW [Paucibacter sp. R3-3]MDY0747074.1 type IV pilus biogenesis/stability protein PilW [Paucibacter sp. R3-3]
MTRAQPLSEQQFRSRWFWAVAAAVLSMMTVACTTTSTGADGSAREVPKTESDTTNAERRANVRTELAKGYFTQGQYTTALDEIKQALAAKPDMRDAINLRGLVYAAMGEIQLADDSFRRAQDMFPRDPDIMHNYGWYLCQQKRYPAAFEQFSRALAQPDYRGAARTLLARGVCELSAGQSAEAQASLAKAFELDPANPAIAYNLANVLYRNKEYERARFYINRVNAQAGQSNAQTLWLELRVERKLGHPVSVDELGQRLRKDYAQSPENLSLGAGRFDD